MSAYLTPVCDPRQRGETPSSLKEPTLFYLHRGDIVASPNSVELEALLPLSTLFTFCYWAMPQI